MGLRRAWPWAALAVGAAVRWRAWRTLAPIANERSSTYLQQARELVQRLAFDNPEALRRPPVYPAFLAAHLALFGERLSPVVASQHLLGLAAVALWMLIAQRTWKSPLVTAAVSLLAGLDPFTLYFESNIESESVFLFLMALTIFLVVRALEGRRGRRALLALAGGAAGAAALCRPEFALFPLAAAPALLTLDEGWKDALVLGAPAALLVLAWMSHNALVFGAFTLSLMGGITSLQTSGPFIDWSAPSNALAKQAYREALTRGGGTHLAAGNDAVVILMREHGLKFAEAARAMASLGAETFLRHPFAYLWAARRNFADYFAGLGGGDAPALALWPGAHDQGGLPVRLFWWLLAAGSAAGLAAAWRRKGRSALLLACAAAYVVVSNCLVEIGSVDRRCLELQPFLLVFLGLALAVPLGSLFKERPWK